MDEPQSRAWLVSEVAASLDEAQLHRLHESASAGLLQVLLEAQDGPNDWVPTRFLIEALVLSDRLSGSGDLNRCWDIGEHVATHEIGPVQALAARVLRPSMLMSLAPSLFSTHFKAAGRVAILPTGERALVVSFSGFSTPHRAHCFALGGWMKGWLARGPRRSIRVEHVSCLCDGRMSCDYAVSWED